jgi:hypothetical protein
VDKSDGGGGDTEKLSTLRNGYVRKDYYYPKRGDNTPYSDIHLNSLTAHVAMNGNETGKTAMSVTVEGLENTEKLKLAYEVWGEPVKSDTAALGVKVDYHTAAGYTKSVYYHYKDFAFDMLLPFGTSAASMAVSMGDALAGTQEIALIENAPAEWDGRIMVSYLCQDAGKNTTAKFIIGE